MLISLAFSGGFIAGVLFWIGVAGWIEAKRARRERERALYLVEF